MSAELARFDTRRAAQTEQRSEQTDFRTIGAREHGQLALDEVETTIGAAGRAERENAGTLTTTNDPTRGDLKAALGCARATIDGLREHIRHLEAERDRLRQETKAESDR